MGAEFMVCCFEISIYFARRSFDKNINREKIVLIRLDIFCTPREKTLYSLPSANAKKIMSMFTTKL